MDSTQGSLFPSKWRTGIVVLLSLTIVVISAMFIVFAGMTVPSLFINSGVDDYLGGEREVAQTVHNRFDDEFLQDSDIFFMTAGSVETAGRCSDAKSQRITVRGTVQTYTIFGLPSDVVEISCDGG